MIVLLGPTGETARRILDIAHAGGVEIRLAARDPDGARGKLGALCDGLTIDKVDARDQIGQGDLPLARLMPMAQNKSTPFCPSVMQRSARRAREFWV